MTDLFEHYEQLPQKVQDLILEFGECETYDHCEELLRETEKLGYTFDYDLSATPFNLEKIMTNEYIITYKTTNNRTYEAIEQGDTSVDACISILKVIPNIIKIIKCCHIRSLKKITTNHE